MTIRYYKLVGREVLPLTDDVQEWAEHETRLDEKDPLWRRVALTEVQAATDREEAVTVSTIFLGFDHGFNRGRKLFFETMIFGGPHNLEQQRCSTWDEAVRQHEEMVEVARS